MNVITIKKAMRFSAEEFATREGTQRFVVEKQFPEPAITIVGDREANGIGPILPQVVIHANWNSPGICLEQLDNAGVGPIKVERSNGIAVRVRSCRQSLFDAIQATESVSAVAAVEIDCIRESQGDSTNACRFNFVSVYACASNSLLSIRGNTVLGLGTCRHNQFGFVFLHTIWERQLNRLPVEMRGSFFLNKNRWMLLMNNCQDIGFERLKVTTDDQSKVFGGDRVRRCRFAGQALVYDRNQVGEFGGEGNDYSMLATDVRSTVAV